MDGLDELKKSLMRQLDKLEAAGDFASLNRYNAFSNPGLEIGGSIFPLPLTSRDAETLKGVCTQASFGRGDETVVDESVRKTWELAASQFRLVNPAWPGFLHHVSRDVVQVLGMTTVRLEPYKLLLYEEGSFFKRHKDSEKAPGMIGTLIVCLPSKHEGGDVHLSFGDKHYTFDTSCTSAFDLTVMGWFSDVTHEVTKLSSGYRLILTYNIIQTGTGNPCPTILVRQQALLGRTLRMWRENFPEKERLLYALEHKYTQSSLSMRYMKGRDYVVCHILGQIASEHGFFLFLANLTRHENEYAGVDLTLDHAHTFSGEKVAIRVDVKMDDIVDIDPYGDRDADSEDEEEFTGNESMPANFRYHDTVVLIVPKTHLKQFVRRGPGLAVVWRMVEEDLNKNPQSASIQQYAVSVMGEILKALEPTPHDFALGFIGPATSIGTEVLSAIAKWAFKLGADHLSQEVARHFIRIQAPHVFTELVAESVNEEFRKTSSIPVWENRLDALIKASGDLNSVNRLLSSVQTGLCHEDLRQSFKAWQTARLEDEVFQKASLSLSDLDSIMHLVDSHLTDQDWIQSRLIPKLGNRGDKRVLCFILLRFFAGSYQNGTALTKTVAHAILDAHSSELRLGILDFPPRDEYLRQLSLPTRHVHMYPFLFLNLISLCLDQEREQVALSLLNTSCSDILGSWDSWPADLPFIDDFLLGLPVIFQKHNNCEVSPLVKELWLACFRKYIAGDISLPPKPRGQTHKRRGCGPPTCPDCQELDRFLQSETEKTFRLAVNGERRKHVQSRLPYNLFDVHTDKIRHAGGCHSLVVKKLGKEYRQDLHKYHQLVDTVKTKTRPFKTDSVKTFIGDDLYGELVLLSHLSAPGTEAGSSSGHKRGASDSWEGSSASRPWVI